MLNSLDYPFDWAQIQRKSKQIKRLLLEQDQSWIEKKLAVLGGSTTFEVTKTLELFCLRRGIKPSFYESDFGLYYEDLKFGNPKLLSFKPDIIYFHTTTRNLKRLPQVTDSPAAVDEKLESELHKIISLWDKAKELGCVVIQNNFELPYVRALGNLDAVLPQGNTRFINLLNLRLADAIAARKGVYLNDIHSLAARMGLMNWYSDELWRSYKYALRFQAIPDLANNLAAIIASLYGRSKKALVLDLDDTLWGGVIGDDGLSGIRLGPDNPEGEGFVQFQKYLRQLRDRGILLAVCSKNDFDITKSAFTHPDSVLQFEDFAEFAANWGLKSENIKNIAKSLNVGIDSLVYIDDSAFERAEVRNQVKGLEAPEVTNNPVQTMEAIDRSGFFEISSLSSEDLQRNAMYSHEKKRDDFRASFASNEEFLRSLEMRATIRPFESTYVDRITQLINKTNQFNLTAKRYTLEAVTQLMQETSSLHLWCRLEDRFGDNGLVAAIIGRGVNQHEIDLDVWVMSCRAFKRDVEFAMFDHFIRRAKATGCQRVFGTYVPTAKNKIVEALLSDLKFTKRGETAEGHITYVLDIDEFSCPSYHIEVTT